MNKRRSIDVFFSHANTLRYLALPLLWVLILVTLTNCKRGHKTDRRLTTLEVSYPQSGDGEEWIAYSYGVHRADLDTLPIKRGKITWKKTIDRDSTDAILLYDQSGLPVAPLLFLEESKAYLTSTKRKGKLKLDGLKEAAAIQTWLELRPLCTPELQHTPDEVITFLKAQSNSVLAPVVIRTLKQRYPKDKNSYALDSMMRYYTSQRRNILDALGISSLAIPDYGAEEKINFPYVLPGKTKEGDMLTLERLRGKARVVIVAALSPFADQETDNAYSRALIALDTLGVPTYTLLPERTTVPSGWKHREVETSGNKIIPHVYVVDSTGNASSFLSGLSINTLPFYAVVDTAAHIIDVWHHPDSVVQYVRKTQPEK